LKINLSGMKSCCCTLILLLLSLFTAIYSQTGTGKWLETLNEKIQQSATFDAAKKNKIKVIQAEGYQNGKQASYNHYLKLYNEYCTFNFDSAYLYAGKLLGKAADLNDPALISYSKIKLNFVLLSSGMFKEVFDSLHLLVAGHLNSNQKAELYILKARSYFDLSDYIHDNYYSQQYNKKAFSFLDSSLSVLPPNSFDAVYYSGLKEIRSGNIEKATARFIDLLKRKDLSTHEQALVYSTYSDVFVRKAKTDSAIILLAMAAVADIESSTKETSAISNLASFLFKQGDVKNASLFIQKAASDAKIYGARQRMIQLSSIQPLIESEKLNAVEKDKSNIFSYAVIISVFLLLLLVSLFVIFRQVGKMKTQQKVIHQKNTSLHHMVEEKEWLLKEIHHRVKNNLHTINSLLESQALYLDGEALTAIKDSQHRVFAMSLIHQKLYQPENNLTGINMPVYLHELVSYLAESFETGNRIQFKLDLEPLELDISLAVPIGLILNEAITNAVKYAFPANREGTITISIKSASTKHYTFKVADNGVGLPENFDADKVNALGIKLMKGLSGDIAASFNMESENGTTISIAFLIDQSINSLKNGVNHSFL
jgi:two-component sensor histidine kinase